MEILQVILDTYFVFVVLYFIGVNTTYFTLLWLSLREIVSYMHRRSFTDYRSTVQSEITPPVSILAPAYNEEPTIVESIRSLLKLAYGEYEVIVINDGSTDGTLQRMIREFQLFPSRRVYVATLRAKPVRGVYRSRQRAYANLVVVDKENGGKADALNVGINAAQYDYVCAIDADSILEDNALQKVMKPFLEDETVVATGGIVRIANGCEIVNGRVIRVGLSDHMLPIFQVVEYFRAFLSGRMGWQAVNGLLIISGAFGMFRRDVVLQAGGYNPETVGEDMELVARLHRMLREQRRPYRIVFVPDPVCWTEAPESIRMLARQRNRWHRGLLDTLLIHRQMFLNDRYGIIGTAAMPYFFFVELLGPVVELLGYVSLALLWWMGAINVPMTLLFFIVAIVYGVMFSVGAVLLEEVSFRRYPNPKHLALLLAFGVLENFGYRQLTAFWRIGGIIDYVRGAKGWGAMQRRGFSTPAPAS